MKTKGFLLRLLLYVLLLVVLYILETSAGLSLQVFGFRLDLLPAMVASVALCSGSTEGAILGFLAGILCDIAGVQIEGIYPAYFMLTGILLGFVGQHYLKQTISAAVILTIGTMAVLDGGKAAVALLFLKESSGLLMAKAICGEILMAAILSPLVFLAVDGISRKCKREDR